MRQGTRSIILLLAALLVGAAGLWTVPLGTAHAEAPPVSAARLRIELTTTADWATVRLEGLAFPATRTLEADPQDRLTPAGDAWTVVDDDGDGSRLVVDTVAAELSGREAFTISLDQGLGGTTTVQLHDDRRGPGPMLQLTTGDAVGVLQVERTLSRAELLGTDELDLPHADPRRLVLAAYYPWFKREGNPTDRMAEEPLQPRSAWDLDDVRSHVAQARGAGIDGFAVSWSGNEDDGRQLDLVLRASEEQGSLTSIYLETAEARGLLGRVDEATVARWLDEALARGGHPAFLRAADGVPIVFVFAMERLPTAAWEQLAAASAARGRPVHLVGDADPATHSRAMAGWHRYGASGTGEQLAGLWRTMAHRLRGPHLLDPAQPNRLLVATVSPGYDDTRLRGDRNPVIPREGGARYLATWAAARIADPDMVLVTSWNEWFEGTSVEPGTVNGELALRQTAEQATAWKAGSQPPAPTTTTTTAPTTTTTTDPTTTTTTTTPPAPAPAPCRPIWPLCFSWSSWARLG
jgi:hypothetical protein